VRGCGGLAGDQGRSSVATSRLGCASRTLGAGLGRVARGYRGEGRGCGKGLSQGWLGLGRGRLYDYTAKKTRTERTNNRGRAHRRKKLVAAKEKNTDWVRTVGRIDKSKASDEALGETNTTVPSDSTNDARIESNCSPSELEPLQTSSSNSGSWELNMRKPFYDSECA
jgi:hypothetical protein